MSTEVQHILSVQRLYERFSDSPLGDEVFETALVQHFTQDEWSSTALAAAALVAQKFEEWCDKLPGDARPTITEADRIVIRVAAHEDLFGAGDDRTAVTN